MINIVNSKFEHIKILSVDTPVGKMEAVVVNDPDYPCVQVLINDEIVSITEYVADEMKVRTISYQADDDMPINITDYAQYE